ncbi:hypothetical protein HK101_010652 [Irineochytrium annulatum]|nr:hypothetical protein HK101_010652 [Irineochytrium annulatum]
MTAAIGSGEGMSLLSLLDNDYYKFTMQYAAITSKKGAMRVVYRFRDRKHALTFPSSEAANDFIRTVRRAVQTYLALTFEPDEVDFLMKCLSSSVYGAKSEDETHAGRLATHERFLRSFSFDGCTVSLNLDESSQLQIEIRGPWRAAILLEVPLMAMVSECYHAAFSPVQAEEEALKVDAVVADFNRLVAEDLRLGSTLTEMGTRRRRSAAVHQRVATGLSKSILTSNVLHARSRGQKPVGTCAHEWFMFFEAIARRDLHSHAAASTLTVEDVKASVCSGTVEALSCWFDAFPNWPLLALTDAFGTGRFVKWILQGEGGSVVRTYDASGLINFRQDSGDPHRFVDRLLALGVKMHGKTVMHSDGLDSDGIRQLTQEHAVRATELDGIKNALFGVGTAISNPFESKLDIVIKMAEADGVACFKLSDASGKMTCWDEGLIDILKDFERVYPNYGFE